jgi:hypothetical protein
MHTELLSKTDNTVRTIEVMIGLTDAETRTFRATEYVPATLHAVYTKLDGSPWAINRVWVYGPRLNRDNTFDTYEIVEQLLILTESPALAALVIEHLPKDE